MRVNTEEFFESTSGAVQNQGLQARLRVLNSFTVKRDRAFAELEDGEALRDRARAIKEDVIANLDGYLSQLEASIKSLGGAVHWARDGEKRARSYSTSRAK